MNINDIFLKRKKRWGTINRLRDSEEQADGSLTPSRRIALISDDKSFRELYAQVKTGNPNSFPGYEKKVEANRLKTGQQDAVVTGTCRIGGVKTAVAVMDKRFLMGSMGIAVGEKITRLTEYAMKRKLPLIIFAASGGARMQEGLFSLMQMAKTTAAIEKFKDAGGLFISYLTNPTTGGVSASFASLGDIIIAEPGALICFAGPRVIEQTIGQKLPEGFQHSEFLLEHGMIDMIVERYEADFIKDIENACEYRRRSMSSENVLTPYEKVLAARKSDRPDIMKYIEVLFDDFIEMHGDRYYKDDKSLVAGIASFNGKTVTVIGNRKGKNIEENIRYNFGMASPEGYRKAVRVMKQAEKFRRPVITFVDTPGAYPGMEAESNGQSNAIAGSIAAMLKLTVPVISVITGEGGSGGALALAAADKVYMLENAVYSILSPEGFASIIYKDAKKAPQASEIMKLTAQELFTAGLVDGVIAEGDRCFSDIARMLEKELGILGRMKSKELVNSRYDKFRNIDRGEIK